MGRLVTFKVLASCAIGLTGLTVGSVLAAEVTEEAPSTGGLEEVIVTSQKRSEKLQDVPISVTAITGDELSAANISTQAGLPAVTPNLLVNYNSDFVAPYIRGIGTQFANAGLDPSVALYLDDQYYPRASGGMFSMADIARIEVLKGPQGTLYGRNTVGGAIRIITNEASPDFLARADVTTGNLGRIGGDAILNGQLLPGLNGRVSFDFDSDGGYIHSQLPGIAQGARHQYQLLGKLLWEPTDRLQVHLRGDLFDKKDTEGEAFLPITNMAPTQIGIALGGLPSTGFYDSPSDFFKNPSLKSHDTSVGGVLRADYRFDPVTFSSISAFRHITGRGFADLDTTSINFEPAASPVVRTSLYTQEFQLVSNLTGPLKYTAGVYLLHSQERYWFDVGGLAVAPPPAPSNLFISGDGTTTVSSGAAYGEATYSVASRWDVTLGGRFTYEKKEMPHNWFVAYLGVLEPGLFNGQPFSNGVAPGQIVSAALVDSDKSILYRRFTPKATVTYKPMDRVMLYATFSRGFKSGGFNLPSFGPVDEVRPESVSSYELGWKTEYSRVRFNGAFFYEKQKDLQVQLTDQKTGGTHVVNAASTKIYGIESDIDWAALDSLTLSLGAGYLHATYSDFVGDAYRPCNAPLPNPTPAQSAQFAASCAASGGLGLTLVSGNDFSGNKLSLAPSFTGNVRAAYELPIPANYGSFRASTIVSYTGSFVYNPEATLVEPSKTLLTANLGWTSPDSRYHVTVYGTNLTNKEYTTTKTYQGTGGWYVAGRPREYGVTVGVNFK